MIQPLTLQVDPCNVLGMEIKVKPAKIRRPKQPRTCCPTHNDRCAFGHMHVWCWGNMIDGVWVAESMICHKCGARCVDEER